VADELTALHRTIERLPDDVTAALKSVARVTAQRVRDRAEQILDSKTGGKGSRIAAIGIAEEPEQKRFLVIAEGAAGKPKNMALWFERGTQFMVARPYMRPAADAESERYQRDGLAAAVKVADKLGQ
jgi:hypothetical protein